MSRTALTEYNNARITQTTQNDARTIRTGVKTAQQNPARAGVRWPFELMQNAHDAGPRAGDQHVKISFTFRDNDLVVSHTGKPFTAQELVHRGVSHTPYRLPSLLRRQESSLGGSPVDCGLKPCRNDNRR